MNQGSHKPKLRPSQDVLQRLRWDPRFDAGAYLVVYRERGGGSRELAVPSFLESKRIPWSRVIAVRHRSGDLIWDRARRLDRLFGSGETPEDDLMVPGADGGQGFGIALDPWRWNGEAWIPGSLSLTPPAPRPLRVLCWNLLFDRFEPDRIDTARRLPVQLEILRTADADLIALQEVTPSFWAELLAEPWVREGYWVSDGLAGPTLEPSGQATLSRLPLESVRIHAFSAQKRVVVTSIETSEGRLVVANLHLTSNRAPKAPEIRAQQLRSLTRQLQRAHPDDDWLVLGDFNQRVDEPDGGLVRAGARDLWPQVAQGPGATYDPERNALAAFFSSKAQPARFDRVYLRARSDRWRGASAELLATDPIPACDPPLWPSDHFALSVHLTPGDGLAGVPVRSTALALVPPASLWGPLQALRQIHDDRISRWPPHVNLLFGFVDEDRFPAALARLAPLAASLEPAELELSRVERFAQRKETVLWLAPEPVEAVTKLQAELVTVFPGCAEERRFTPHLTLGRLARGAGDAPTRAAWAEAVGTLRWIPDAIFFLAREGRGAFRVRAALPLGPPRSLLASLEDTGLLLQSGEEEARRAASETLSAACVAAGAIRVEPIGSVGLGVALSTSDVDLWAELAEPPGPWLAALAQRVDEILPGSQGEVVPAGESEQLRLHVELATGALLRIDLQASEGSAFGAREREALKTETSGAPQAFRLGLLGLRVWAHLRQFDRQAFGALGGVAWAALAAHVWKALETPSADALLTGALERIAAGGQSLAGGRSGSSASASPHLWALSDPTRDLAASLRPSVWRALRHEALAALPLAEAATEGRGAWSGLFLPVNPPPAPRARLSIELEPDQAPAAAGWVASLAQELLRRLEQSGGQPRPYPEPIRDDAIGGGRIELTWWIELRSPPPAPAWERVANWLDRAARHAPHGSRVEFELDATPSTAP